MCLRQQNADSACCGQIGVMDSTIVQAHRPAVINMESEFGNCPVKCVVLDDDTQDQFIIDMDFLTHPEINAVLNFKDAFMEMGNKCLPLLLRASSFWSG
uniref:Uncharacterized protein n=1 Tax=Romanomermis culicivorax TaxID=13658 RepID=A0A915K284_ROMCU